MEPNKTDKKLLNFGSPGSLWKPLLSVPVVILAILLVVIMVKCLSKKKFRRQANLKEIVAWSGLYWFCKREIENAMNYGGEKICLGRGSTGQVYRGVLPSGQLVAIKHLTKSNTSESFTREVEGLSRLRHPNLVCLFGCCIEGDERYLVYEFCANGNLAQHLLSNVLSPLTFTLHQSYLTCLMRIMTFSYLYLDIDSFLCSFIMFLPFWYSSPIKIRVSSL